METKPTLSEFVEMFSGKPLMSFQRELLEFIEKNPNARLEIRQPTRSEQRAYAEKCYQELLSKLGGQ